MSNDERLLEWAQREHELRIADLADRTPEGLRRAQDNAEARRKAAGLSRNQAAAAVSEAGRIRRRQETARATPSPSGADSELSAGGAT